MYKRILLPLDSSSLAEQVLPHAIAMAKHFQSELVLLQVLIPLPRPLTTAEASIRRAEQAMGVLAREYLESVAAGMQERGIAAHKYQCPDPIGRQ